MGMKCMRGLWSFFCASMCSSFCIYVCRDLFAWSLLEVSVTTEDGGERFFMPYPRSAQENFGAGAIGR